MKVGELVFIIFGGLFGGMRYLERDSLTLYYVCRELPTNIVDSNHQQQEVTNHSLNATRRWDGGSLKLLGGGMVGNAM